MGESLVRGGVGRAGESCVHLADASVATKEEGGWPAIEVDGLRDFFVELLGLARQEHRIGDAVTGDEGTEAGRVFELVSFLKGEADDFEATSLELAVKALKKRSFVVAVGAPGTTDGDDDDLAVELGIGVCDDLAGEVGKPEGEAGAGVADGGLPGGIGGFGEFLLAGLGRATGD